MRNTTSYESPFCTRYASEEMQHVFSADKKFSTWRKLWVALARAEMELGLPITPSQVKELEDNVYNIDYDVPRLCIRTGLSARKGHHSLGSNFLLRWR